MRRTIHLRFEGLLMIPTRSNSSRRRNTLLASVSLAAVALSTALTSPLSASAVSGPGIIICPPQITKIGTVVSHEVLDGGSGSGFDASITSGALPDGLVIDDTSGSSPRIAGTPTKVGSYAFHLHFANNVGGAGDKTCVMDIVPSTSIVERIDGDDRYEVAAHIAQLIAPAKTPLVYVASGENYSDALSASAIAAQHNAPLVLATSSGFTNYAYNVVNLFQAADVVLVGGENSLTRKVEDELHAMSSHPKVTRIGGADRFEVSRNLISNPKFGAMASTSISVASGLKFPDALSASPAAAKIKTPVLLVNGEATAISAVEKALLTSRGVTSATVFGGEDTLSAAVAADIKSVTGALSRIEGFDRFVVSANITAANYTAPVDTIYFATGANYPDALAGGVLAGIDGSPILLVRKNCVQPEVAAQVRRLAPKHIVLLGGPNSLDANLENLPLCS
ncbi:cell wall-binding repeat-containing protein [Herbiconiux sp. UC225_62]|uniref:cell wall-binding repeat-containing protein n=1 Tax=Herbiconiux sp. UC225_62 TaxID=3350168 RepID=UPI0036D3D306